MGLLNFLIKALLGTIALTILAIPFSGTSTLVFIIPQVKLLLVLVSVWVVVYVIRVVVFLIKYVSLWQKRLASGELSITIVLSTNYKHDK